MKRLLALLVVLSPCTAAPDAVAAEAYDNCRAFITALPATISVQGTYCLKYNLTTNLTSGEAILVATNNVTLDCNGFRILDQGGAGTDAYGIRADSRANLTVRDCNIRGFRRGISVTGSASSGHVIEDNLVEANTQMGIHLVGTGHTVRRNALIDNGGMTAEGETMAIRSTGDADILDNQIDGVFPSSGGTQSGSFGILMTGSTTSVIRGNRIRSIDGGNSSDYAVSVSASTFAEVSDNHLQRGAAGGNGNFGVYCSPDADEIVTGNRMYGYGIDLVNCDDDGGNVFQD